MRAPRSPRLAGAVTAAARPRRPSGSCLPPGDVPSCERACVSKRIASPPSPGAREAPVPAASCRVAASPHPRGSLPTHPAPSRPLPASPRVPGSSSSCRSRLPEAWRSPSEEGRGGRGRRRRCLPGRGGRTRPSGSRQGLGRVLGGERGGEDVPGGGGPAAEPPTCPTQAREPRASCAVGREAGCCPPPPGGLGSLPGEPAQVT